MNKHYSGFLFSIKKFREKIHFSIIFRLFRFLYLCPIWFDRVQQKYRSSKIINNFLIKYLSDDQYFLSVSIHNLKGRKIILKKIFWRIYCMTMVCQQLNRIFVANYLLRLKYFTFTLTVCGKGITLPFHKLFLPILNSMNKSLNFAVSKFPETLALREWQYEWFWNYNDWNYNKN